MHGQGVIGEIEGVEHEEGIPGIVFHLGKLFFVQAILDGKGMQGEEIHQGKEFLPGRV